MKGNEVKSWFEILANVGVLIGIIVVVYELNQNSIDQRMSARLSIAERYSDLNISVTTNPQLAELLVKAEYLGGELSLVEKRQYWHHNAQLMQILNRAAELHQDGVLTDDAWREYICEMNRHYRNVDTSAFREFVEEVRKDFLSERVYTALRDDDLC